jgi:hypothetical protein
MNDWNKITKKRFDDVFNKHLSSKWVKFTYSHFSKEATSMVLNNTILISLVVMFLTGFLSTALHVLKPFIGVITISYSIILALLVLYLFSAIYLNNRAVKLIIKELGITKEEYVLLVNKYRN